MAERSRTAAVVSTALVIGGVLGGVTELTSPWLAAYLGVSAIVVFGLGLGVVEGPTLLSAIYLARKITRAWVRSALQATAPFLGFFAYLVAYGFLRHPIFSFPFGARGWLP